jgi:mannose/fructose-specific phosphotransferase system component IIA
MSDGSTGAPGSLRAPGAVVPALLVMHADLASALLRAAEKVYGPIDGVRVLSNEGLSREGLEEAIEREVDGWHHGGLVLTDFWGGSCHTCGMAAARGHGEVVILTGVNLPALLDYLHNRERYPVVELGERLRQKAQDSIRLQRSPSP